MFFFSLENLFSRDVCEQSAYKMLTLCKTNMVSNKRKRALDQYKGRVDLTAYHM